MMNPAASKTDGKFKSAAVHLSSVSKSFGSVKVLDGVDLDVASGELMTLLGPSGSGKTSTLMAVAGFLQPDTGVIRVGDRDVTHIPPGRERDMGIVFQNYALFPHMTVAENIAYPLKVRGVKKHEIAKRVQEMVNLVQLGSLADRKPARLSGGQQQRVALARALSFSPSVLLMDEPMGALDVRLKEELQWEVRRLQREIGATILYVTHDQTESMVLSDRVCLMDAGKIVQVAAPQALYQKPKTLFAAKFLGESNLIEGKFVKGRGLEIGGSDLLCPVRNDSDLIDSKSYHALIRPEFLSLSTTGQAQNDGQSFSFRGEVIDAVFVGQTIRYEVTNSFGVDPIIVQTPASLVDSTISSGANVILNCRLEHIHLIEADNERGGNE